MARRLRHDESNDLDTIEYSQLRSGFRFRDGFNNLISDGLDHEDGRSDGERKQRNDEELQS